MQIHINRAHFSSKLIKAAKHIRLLCSSTALVACSIILAACLLVSLQASSALAETQESKPTRPTVALALGGGGTRGLAHIGVLRVFEQAGIKIDYVAGTSIGAIIGGLYCAGVPLERIEQVFFSKQLLRSFNTVPIGVRVAAIPIFFVPHLFGYKPYDGLYRGNKFAHFLNKTVPECHRNIEDLPTPFCAVASNLLDAKVYAITSGNLSRAIQASSALPVLRRPVSIGDRLYIDGGIQANLPVIQAKQMGADIVIAVDVDENFLAELPKRHFRRIGSVGHRALDMVLAKVDEPQLKAADVVIRPDVTGIHILSSKTKDASYAMDAGTKAALEALPQIREKFNTFSAAATANSGEQSSASAAVHLFPVQK